AAAEPRPVGEPRDVLRARLAVPLLLRPLRRHAAARGAAPPDALLLPRVRLLRVPPPAGLPRGPRPGAGGAGRGERGVGGTGGVVRPAGGGAAVRPRRGGAG